jgi:hypothetical protein
VNEIQNTTEFVEDGGAYLILAAAMGGASTSEIITDMERRGQKQLVAASVLPTDTQRTDSEFEAVGFTFGEPAEGDPMFRQATLPAGWSRQGSDHDMWSYVVDELGRRRVSVFYKAAWYDRSAHMHLTSVGNYVSECIYEDKPIVGDDAWATVSAVREALTKLAGDARKHVTTWERIRDRDAAAGQANAGAKQYITEYRAEAEKYEALLAQDGGQE